MGKKNSSINSANFSQKIIDYLDSEKDLKNDSNILRKLTDKYQC